MQTHLILCIILLGGGLVYWVRNLEPEYDFEPRESSPSKGTTTLTYQDFNRADIVGWYRTKTNPEQCYPNLVGWSRTHPSYRHVYRQASKEPPFGIRLAG